MGEQEVPHHCAAWLSFFLSRSRGHQKRFLLWLAKHLQSCSHWFSARDKPFLSEVCMFGARSHGGQGFALSSCRAFGGGHWKGLMFHLALLLPFLATLPRGRNAHTQGLFHGPEEGAGRCHYPAQLPVLHFGGLLVGPVNCTTHERDCSGEPHGGVLKRAVSNI